MKASEMRNKSPEELLAYVAEKRAEVVQMRRSLRSGELANPSSISKIRREIATALTVVNEQNSAGSTAEEDK